MKYTVKKNGNTSERILHKDGIQTVCPFPQPFPMPSQDGKGMVIMRVPCTTQCPHAEITNDGRWEITCGGVVRGFVIEEEVLQAPEPEVSNPEESNEGAKIVTF
jgi:hypothetical protein